MLTFSTNIYPYGPWGVVIDFIYTTDSLRYPRAGQAGAKKKTYHSKVPPG
jgi:hypothetical protein